MARDSNTTADQSKRSYTPVPGPIHDQAMDLIINKEMSISAAADLLEVKRSALSKRIKKHRSGSVATGRPRGRKPILSTAEKEKLFDLVDANCSVTLKALANQATTDFQLRAPISTSTVRQVLKDFHYSFKCVTKVPVKCNCERTLELRRMYAADYTRLLSRRDKFVFVDEVGFSCALRVRSGWSHQSKCVHLSTNAIRSQNFSVASAMMANGLVMYKVQRGAYNGEAFHLYIDELIEALHEASVANAVVIMDNHSTGAWPFATVPTALLTVFNPIEEFFSKWKGLVRRRAVNNEQELFAAIENCSQLVSEDDCRGYFRHMEDYIHPSLEGEEINS